VALEPFEHIDSIKEEAEKKAAQVTIPTPSLPICAAIAPFAH
jgi:hypothetical protein